MRRNFFLLLFVLFAGVAAVAALGAGVFSISLAFAHSRPVRFDPAPGSILTTAPAQINGWFDEAVRSDPNWTFIHVLDSKGNRVDTGTTTLSSDRLQMTATLKPGLGAGMYVVNYRSWDDSDGAIFGDCFTFFVGQAAADAAIKAPTRLDDGGSCERIDTGDAKGTPVPSTANALATAAAGGTAADFAAASDSGGGSSGVPAWTLAIAAVGGLVVGGGAMRFVKGK